MMSDLEEMLKDVLLILWCLYITAMSIYSMFQIEEAYEFFVIVMVWAWGVAIPAALRGT